MMARAPALLAPAPGSGLEQHFEVCGAQVPITETQNNDETKRLGTVMRILAP